MANMRQLIVVPSSTQNTLSSRRIHSFSPEIVFRAFQPPSAIVSEDPSAERPFLHPFLARYSPRARILSPAHPFSFKTKQTTNKQTNKQTYIARRNKNLHQT